MKILFTCYENLALSGSSSIQVIQFAKAFSQNGHDVRILCPSIGRFSADVHNAPELEGRIAYIPVINLPVLRLLSYFVLSFFYTFLYMKSFKPDWVMDFEVYLDLPKLLAFRASRAKYVFFVNALADEELSGLRKFIIKVVTAVQKAFAQSALLVATISEEIKDVFLRQYGAALNIKIVKNGVDSQLFSPRNINASKTALKLDKDCFYIGFVGKFYPWHGLDFIVEAAKLVSERNDNIRFLLVGSGQTENDTRALVSKYNLDSKFIFAGQAPYNNIPLYINSCGLCFVFYKPVRSYAGDPMKMYEYMSCAKPVLASRVKGYGDLLEKYEAGISVNAADPRETADTILRLCAEPEKLVKMGNNGRSAVLANYSWLIKAKELEGHMNAV